MATMIMMIMMMMMMMLTTTTTTTMMMMSMMVVVVMVVVMVVVVVNKTFKIYLRFFFTFFSKVFQFSTGWLTFLFDLFIQLYDVSVNFTCKLRPAAAFLIEHSNVVEEFKDESSGN